MVPAFCRATIAKHRKVQQGGSASVPPPLLGSPPGVPGATETFFPFAVGGAMLGLAHFTTGKRSFVWYSVRNERADGPKRPRSDTPKDHRKQSNGPHPSR